MVLALVLFRKVMDYFPGVFSQRDLFWLDNLMPSSGEKKDEENEDEMEENKVKSFNFRVVKFSNFLFFQNGEKKRFFSIPKLWKVENEVETNHTNNVTLLKT